MPASDIVIFHQAFLVNQSFPPEISQIQIEEIDSKPRNLGGTRELELVLAMIEKIGVSVSQRVRLRFASVELLDRVTSTSAANIKLTLMHHR